MHISIILSLLATGIATLSFPLEAYYDESSQRLQKRAEYPNLYMESGLFQARVYYNIGSGANSQFTNGILSTYFADLVLQTSSNPKCSSDLQTINRGNGVNCTFGIHTSSSAVSSSELEDTWYNGSGNTNTTIKFFEADINLNDDIFENYTFAAITDGLSNPFFGLGYPFESLVRSYDFDTGVTTLPDGYMTPLQAMKSQDLILSESYSVWLSSLAPGSPGGLSIGGFDRLRFDDSLTTVPIDYEWYLFTNGSMVTLKGYSVPLVTVNSVSISDSTRGETTIMRGVNQYALNFGVDYSTLPQRLVDILSRIFRCTYDSSSAYYLCACGVPEGYLTFNTRGYEIRVPYSSFILPLRDYNGAWMAQEDSKALRCFMPVTGTSSRTGYELGMAVLASQYVVVHLDSNEVAFAPYNNYTSTSYEIYQMDENEIRSASPAPSYSSTYDLSDSSISLYTPTFNLSMSALYTATGSQSGSGSATSVSGSGSGQPSSGSGQPGGGSSSATGAVIDETTATTTGSFLKGGTMTYLKTEISTINGSPSHLLSPGFVLAWILGFLL